MLENSQMKENMMLQQMDEILKVDLQTLKAELSQLTTNLAGTFATAVEKVTSHVMSQVEQALVRNTDQAEEAKRLHESEQGKVLEHILLLSHNVSGRLGRLESAWLRRSEAEAQETAFQQDKFSPTRGDNIILNSLWKELQQTRAELKASQKWAAQHLLPAGKSTCAVLYQRALFGGPVQTDILQIPLLSTFLCIRLQSNLMNTTAALSSLYIQGGNPLTVLRKEALRFPNVGSKKGLIKVLREGKAS